MTVILGQSFKNRLALLLLAFLLALLPCCGQAPNPPREAKVARVIDGDTAELEGGRNVSTRPAACHKRQPNGLAAVLP